MTTSFPTGIDSYPSHNTGDIIQAAYDNNEQDAIVAVQTKVGINGSADSTTIDYKLSTIPSTDKAVSKTGTETLTNKTLTSPILTTPIINVGSDATGDVYYRNSGGAYTRLGVGSNTSVLTLTAGLPVWAVPAVVGDASYATKGIVEFLTDAATSGIAISSGIANVNYGVGNNQIVKLDGSGHLPAVDGSALTNLPTQGTWKKISTVTITNVSVAQATAVSLGQWTSLTGDTDDVYQLMWEVKEDTGNGVLGVGIRFNSDSTSGHYAGTASRLTTVNTVDNLAATVSTLGFFWIPTIASGASMHGEIYIKASKTIAGTGRNWHGLSGSTNAASTVWGSWSDTTNQISTIDIMMYQNDGSGARIINGLATLYKINR